MSGIAGLIPVDPGERVEAPLTRMLERMRHRGPDGRGTFCEPGIALGQLAHHTTAEARRERQPLRSRDGRAVLVADLRLDNREELLGLLGLGPEGDGAPGEAELLLRTWERFGESCVERLVGDFAFALWDRAERRLLCARDPFGARSLYWTRTPAFFAFASEIKALLALEGVSSEPDELRIAFFLENVAGEPERTSFRAVHRLAPARTLLVRGKAQEERAHFAFEPARELPRGRDEEHVERFRELFVDAVRARLRTCLPVASLLSGGIDSSSITCVARELLEREGRGPLRTLSVTFDGVPESNERPFIEAVLASGRQEAVLLDGNELAPYGDWEPVADALDQLSYGANLHLHRALYAAGRARGGGVVLDGVGGDIAVDYGLDRFVELFLRGRFLALRKELRAFAGRVHGRPAVVFRRCVRAPIVSSLRSRAPRALRELLDRWRRARGADPDGLPGLVRPELARRLELRERAREIERRLELRPRTARGTVHHLNLTDGLMYNALGTIEGLAAWSGLETRFPFLDRRLVEFCLALPSELRLREGYNRYVLRRALPELPALVRWRDWKGDLGHSLAQGMARFDRPRLERLLGEDAPLLDPWVERGRVRALVEGFLAAPGGGEIFDLSKLLDLATWLRSRSSGSGRLRESSTGG